MYFNCILAEIRTQHICVTNFERYGCDNSLGITFFYSIIQGVHFNTKPNQQYLTIAQKWNQKLFPYCNRLRQNSWFWVTVTLVVRLLPVAQELRRCEHGMFTNRTSIVIEAVCCRSWSIKQQDKLMSSVSLHIASFWVSFYIATKCLHTRTASSCPDVEEFLTSYTLLNVEEAQA
jgi:hypothetical protein